MTEPERTEDPAADEPGPLPTADDVAHAQDAYVRRAPRFGRFIAVGTFAGALLGVIAVVIARIAFDRASYFGSTIFVTALAGAVVGALLGSIIAVRIDHRSRGVGE